MLENKIDLRSDTLTRPTAKMLFEMQNAKVGDDVFGEDPTINELESFAAEMFGMENALFCASGTMTNQIAIKVHTKPGDEVICAEKAHIFVYEGGGIAFNSGCSVKLIPSENGIFGVDDFLSRINPDDIHFPRTGLLAIENTCNKGGGSIWELEDMVALSKAAKANNIPFHLDGARFFNAWVEKKYPLHEIGEIFDSISICLSKGLGAPVGSLLLGSNDFIKQARRIRKVFGGGMRQAGYLAAAGLYALQNNIDRLKVDHLRAHVIAELLKEKPFVEKLYSVETNLVIFKLQQNIDDQKFLENLKDKGVIAVSMGKQLVRFVMHLDVTDEQFNQLKEIIEDL